MTDENDGEERGYDSEDFGQYSIEVDVHLPPEAWNEACERYQTAQEKGYEASLMDFVDDLIELEYNWKVIDEDAGEEPPEPPEDGEQWEEAGRALFCRVYAEVRDVAFMD